MVINPLIPPMVSLFGILLFPCNFRLPTTPLISIICPCLSTTVCEFKSQVSSIESADPVVDDVELS